MKNKMLILILLVFTISCSNNKKNDEFLILTSIEPQAFIIKQLVDTNKIMVKSLLPSGLNPAQFTLRPSDVILISKADVYIRNFVPFEVTSWGNIMSLNKNMKVMNSTKDILKEKKEKNLDETDDLGYDPHYWLSIRKNIEFINKFSKFITDKKMVDFTKFNNKKELLLTKLKLMDKFWSDKFSKINNRSFIIYHPNLGYVADDYDLSQYPLEVDGKSITPFVIKKTIDIVEKYKIRTIFFQKEFDSDKSISLAHSIGIDAVAINTISGNWFNLINTLYNQLYESLK